MPKKYLELLSKQESVGILDKQDLTLLLSVYLKSKGSLEEVQVYYTKKPDGTSERKTRRVAIMYSCILVDEFQNYTPIQLALIRSVLSEKTESIIYVGDLNQQTHIGSIQNWDEIREHFPSHRKVVLEKVYRNDPAILRFLMKVGYRVDEKLLDRPEKGKAEFVSGNALFVLKKYALENEKRHIGILAFEDMELEIFKDKFSESENVHPMTISEAQGLEFDTVFIVGISESLFTHHADGILGDAYKNAYADTVTDYLYVACTRPKKDLFLCADPSLEKPLAEFVKESKGRRGS
jgi:superfamily I DNA/RNA helicase